ncbi:hypothetical protein M0P98_01235 [bacterium]|nr:hypothetical protein [bacterium]
MSRLGPQAKKLFNVSSKTKSQTKTAKEMRKKYTFILSNALMKQVKHSAVEQDKTISQWLEEAIQTRLTVSK